MVVDGAVSGHEVHASDGAVARALGSYLDGAPAAFALTRGSAHSLVYMNTAFRKLTGATDSRLGQSISEALRDRDVAAVSELLDRTVRTGAAVHDQLVPASTDHGVPWNFSVWPSQGVAEISECLLIEIREATPAEVNVDFQREVAERMLLTALHEHDEVAIAEASRARAAFLAAEGRRLAGSLDELETLTAISRAALPNLAAWCVVDLLDNNGHMDRLAMIHRDPVKQALLHQLEGRWLPKTGDAFGVPAILASPEKHVVLAGREATAAGEAPEVQRILTAVGVGTMLTVPLLIESRLVGAITFVADHSHQVFASDDIALAEAIATRGAMALHNARLHGEVVALKVKAEAASDAKTAFLSSMSHELRTPLNAIGGYVELLELGLHGPLTSEQRADLERIKLNQHHLTSLISDVLNFVRIGHDKVQYVIADVVADTALSSAVSLVEPLISRKDLVLDHDHFDESLVARVDPERFAQIVVNLLSNAIKFTARGGRLGVRCEATEQAILVHVTDTGIGIPSHMIEAIFDPFVQVRSGFTERDAGIGLGLAISRGLARAMHGDLTVESEPGAGSRFTLTLPRALDGD